MTYERFYLDTVEQNSQRARHLIYSLGPVIKKMSPEALLEFLRNFYEPHKALAQKIDKHFSSHEDKEARDDYSKRVYAFIAPGFKRLEQAIEALSGGNDMNERGREGVLKSIGDLHGELTGMKFALEVRGQEF